MTDDDIELIIKNRQYVTSILRRNARRRENGGDDRNV